MESYIQITQINDFLFCPASLYFSRMFRDFNERTFHDKPQVVGKISHQAIEEGRYSTRKNVLQNTTVFSEKYGLCGKIDTFNIATGELVERKFCVKQIYLGFKYQLYAQMFCLQEMGYIVRKLAIYSKSDNKKYSLELPDFSEVENFEKLLQKIRTYSPDLNLNVDENKCNNCIYKPLCH